MKILTNKKQRELTTKLLSLARVTDEIMLKYINDDKMNASLWTHYFEIISDNISDITEEISGFDGLLLLGEQFTRSTDIYKNSLSRSEELNK